MRNDQCSDYARTNQNFDTCVGKTIAEIERWSDCVVPRISVDEVGEQYIYKVKTHRVVYRMSDSI
jgi:hypothetical protein